MVIVILAVGLAISSTSAGYLAIRSVFQSAAQTRNGRVISTGSLSVPFNGISYLPFAIDSAPTNLNITFSITDYNSYYPQSVALYLLTQAQYNMFQGGDHNSSTWYYPYSASLNTRTSIPSAGNWYLAFVEQDPNGGFGAMVGYTLRLAN